MKKSLITATVLSAIAATAAAQSSVTLFGILDVGARAVKNGDGSTVKSLTRDGLSGSRLGFRGEEDLGGGLKAGFWLEGGVSVDVGTVGSVAGAPAANGATSGAKFFERRSTVSLYGPFGEIRLGRDYTPTFSNLPTFDIYGAIGVGSIGNIMGQGAVTGSVVLGSGAGTLARADNSIAYFLPPNIGGFYGTVMAAAGEGTNTTNGNNRYIGGRVGWTGGPVNVAGAYGRTRIPGNSDYRVWNLGASYSLPVVKLTAFYQRADYEPSGLPSRSHKTWAVGANVPIGVSEIRATYGRADVSGGRPGIDFGLRNEDDARQYAIGYIYNLSKRTALYADIGRVQNRGLSQS